MFEIILCSQNQLVGKLIASFCREYLQMNDFINLKLITECAAKGDHKMSHLQSMKMRLENLEQNFCRNILSTLRYLKARNRLLFT